MKYMIRFTLSSDMAINISYSCDVHSRRISCTAIKMYMDVKLKTLIFTVEGKYYACTILASYNNKCLPQLDASFWHIS